MTKIVYILEGLLGIQIIIAIHELGHLLMCKLYGVGTPIFSIGFGPELFSTLIGTTKVRFALLPLGGYVQMNIQDFTFTNYWQKMAIIYAGVLSNFVFAFLILLLISFKVFRIYTLLELWHNFIFLIRSAFHLDPLGTLIYGNFTSITRFFIFMMLASIQIGCFNLLPLPLLDGGQGLLYTIQALVGKSPVQQIRAR